MLTRFRSGSFFAGEFRKMSSIIYDVFSYNFREPICEMDTTLGKIFSPTIIFPDLNQLFPFPPSNSLIWWRV